MKKADILEHFKYRGLPIPENPGKVTNKKLENILGIDSYTKNPQVQTWGMYKRLFELSSPQLCFSFKDLKPSEQENILKSKDWIAELKLDGCRVIIFYHPNYGFEFFSRDISDVTFLPNCYTSKILLIMNGKVFKPQDFKGKFKQSFIIDAEVLVANKTLDNSSRGGGFSATELNATVSILGSHSERALDVQLSGNPLHFFVFDLLEFDGKDLKDLKLKHRRELLCKLLYSFEGKLPFKLPESSVDSKQEFFDRTIASGGEGCVLKNLEEKYYATTSRKRDVQVKMKRLLSGSKHGDLDCFISGSIPPKKNSALQVQGLIGGIKVSCYIQEPDGTEIEHWLGTISGMTHALRKKMTVLGSEGEPTLNPEYLDKIITCEGQDISSKSLRISHCRSNFVFRIDKNTSDCTITREFLEENIL